VIDSIEEFFEIKIDHDAVALANTTIRTVTNPLDRLAPLTEGRPRPGA